MLRIFIEKSEKLIFSAIICKLETGLFMDIKNEQIFVKMFGAINSVLNVSGNAYSCDLFSCDLNKTKGYSDYKKGLICIDYKIWEKFCSANTPEEKRLYYAIAAGTAAHEVMHFHQFTNMTSQIEEDFVFEGNLPINSNEWTDEQLLEYFNLSIEIEAFAFGMLIEETLLFGNRFSQLPIQIDANKYQKTYTLIEAKYKNRILNAFCNFL